MKQEKNYQIIARKYRPQNFSDVLGHDAIVTTLKNGLRSKKLAQAYLFCGSRGTGKTTLARLLAKALNCEALTENCEPCNSCQSCKEITAGHSLNVIEIDGASNRGIDDIRQINETIHFTASSGAFKIYIIDEVHMLTREAFNALLKTLEEPPPQVKFFFATTEPHKVLPTIISRCQRYDLRRIPQEAIKQKLQRIADDLKVEIEDEALSLIAQAAEGGLRDAESLFDQIYCAFASPIQTKEVAELLGVLPKELFFELDNAISEKRLTFAFDLAHRLFSEGKDPAFVLESLLEHFRTILYIKTSQNTLPNWISQKEKVHYETAAALYSKEQCLALIDLLIDNLQQMSRLPFKKIHLEMVFLKMIRSKHSLTIDALTNKLIELQNALSITPIPSQSLTKNVIKPQPQKEHNIEPPAPLVTASHTPDQLSPNKTLPQQAPQKQESSLMQRLKTSSPPSDSKPTQPSPPKEPSSKSMSDQTKKEQSHYDTLIRFAAVELEGSVKH
jgi:DNA polymerase-3 subunit gamma/tau